MTTPTLVRQATGSGPLAHLLESQIRGAVHLPGDAAYEQQRAAYRGAPAIVVEAACAEDVRVAVLVAREFGLDLTVQSTGHGTVVAPDDGMLLRTSSMAQVLVDPDRRVAHVGAGVRWTEVIAAAEPFGLAPLSGDTPSVGVVGYTLGGGLSWLSRKYGFAADSLLKVELVTADGRIVTADAHRNAELFWALRGGSGNFGVVTALEFRLHPVPSVFGGTATLPLERAADALRFLGRHGDELPDELSLSLVVTPNGAVVRSVYAGQEADGRQALQPLFDAAGEPVEHTLRTMRYADVSTLGGTAPRGSAMLDDLSDAVIDEIVGAVSRGGVNAVEVKHWGGAIADPQHPNPGPVSHRDVPFLLKIDGPAEAAAGITAHATGGSFLNFLSDTKRTRTAYTPANLRRLRQVKRAYDPSNVFHRNHNIRPAEAAQREA